MIDDQPVVPKRKRAPSKRAIATRSRVLDAAERVFARRGFDGATIRDIAAEAGEPVGTVHHHGGGKEALFHRVIARRAETLSRARLDALDEAKRMSAPLTLEAVLAAFLRPFFDLSAADPAWRDYARLVAFASVDTQWRGVSDQLFDPTAKVFFEDMRQLLPGVSQAQLAEGFVFCVSAMLALLTSRDRIAVLSAAPAEEADQIAHLISFCAAGMRAP